MPASKANWLITYKNSSQVYASASKEIALKSPVPKGCTLEDRTILFLTYEPDEGELCVYPQTPEQINQAMEDFGLLDNGETDG